MAILPPTVPSKRDQRVDQTARAVAVGIDRRQAKTVFDLLAERGGFIIA